MSEHEMDLQPLEKLVDFLGKLEGGDADIGAFNTWFMNSRWEASHADNQAALHLGWDIQGILYEYHDFSDIIPIWRVVEQIRESIGENAEAFISIHRPVIQTEAVVVGEEQEPKIVRSSSSAVTLPHQNSTGAVDWGAIARRARHLFRPERSPEVLVIG